MKLLLEVISVGIYELSLPGWSGSDHVFTAAANDSLLSDKRFVIYNMGIVPHALSRGTWTDDEMLEHATRVADTLGVDFDLA